MVVELAFWVNYFFKIYADVIYFHLLLLSQDPLPEWKWVLQCYRILEFAWLHV